MGLYKLIRAVVGMPPAGVRQPGVGDGYTTTDRKVKIDKKPKHQGKHTGK